MYESKNAGDKYGASRSPASSTPQPGVRRGGPARRQGRRGRAPGLDVPVRAVTLSVSRVGNRALRLPHVVGILSVVVRHDAVSL
jgi:hypothetical protein